VPHRGQSNKNRFNVLPGGTFSDGAMLAIEQANGELFQPDWKKVFDPEAILRSVLAITRA
jgi:D-apionate oxidoisomerase